LIGLATVFPNDVRFVSDSVAKILKCREVNFPQLDRVVPHIILRSPHPRPGKFVLSDAKRVLQQYFSERDIGYGGWVILPSA
jgi:hypothetical protein